MRPRAVDASNIEVETCHNGMTTDFKEGANCAMPPCQALFFNSY